MTIPELVVTVQVPEKGEWGYRQARIPIVMRDDRQWVELEMLAEFLDSAVGSGLWRCWGHDEIEEHINEGTREGRYFQNEDEHKRLCLIEWYVGVKIVKE